MWKLGTPFTITSVDPSRGEICNPVIHMVPCGDLLIYYFDKGDYLFTTTRLLRSRDGGVNWVQEESPVPSISSFVNLEDRVIVYDLHTFKDRNGDYLFFYAESLDGGLSFSEKKIARYHHKGESNPTISEYLSRGNALVNTLNYWMPIFDAGGWSRNEVLGIETGFHAPAPLSVIRLKTGQLLNVFYSGSNGIEKADGMPSFYSHLSISEDGGTNWHHHYGPIGPSSHIREGYVEGCPFRLGSGELAVYFRCGGGGMPIQAIYSKDEAASWSQPVPVDSRIAGIWPKVLQLSDGGLAMANGRPGMFLSFNPSARKNGWDLTSRIDIYDGELLTLKANHKMITSRWESYFDRYSAVLSGGMEDYLWVKKDLLKGNFLSWENFNVVQLDSKRLLAVYDLQVCVEVLGRLPVKAIRGVFVEKL